MKATATAPRSSPVSRCLALTEAWAFAAAATPTACSGGICGGVPLGVRRRRSCGSGGVLAASSRVAGEQRHHGTLAMRRRMHRSPRLNAAAAADMDCEDDDSAEEEAAGLTRAAAEAGPRPLVLGGGSTSPLHQARTSCSCAKRSLDDLAVPAPDCVSGKATKASGRQN